MALSVFLNFSAIINPISEGGGLIQPPPTKYFFKSGYLGARTSQTHWLFLNMYEKIYHTVNRQCSSFYPAVSLSLLHSHTIIIYEANMRHIRERTSMTPSRGATHWSGEIWHMMMPVLRQGWVVKQNMTWWWYFVAMLYRNIITLSNHLQEGILTVTYCTFWIDKTNIISIFVFHSHFF